MKTLLLIIFIGKMSVGVGGAHGEKFRGGVSVIG